MHFKKLVSPQLLRCWNLPFLVQIILLWKEPEAQSERFSGLKNIKNFSMQIKNECLSQRSTFFRQRSNKSGCKGAGLIDVFRVAHFVRMAGN